MDTRPMTLTQKILAHHALGLERPWVQAGDVLSLRVDWTLASELAWNGMERTYQALGRPALRDPERVFLAVDHTVDPVTLAADVRVQRLVQRSRAFARERRLRHFYDANETILHTKFYRDLVLPGQIVLGADSHTTSHGGVGAFAIGLGGADVVAAMVLGETWLEVPEAIAVEYTGQPSFGISGKDIVLRTLGVIGRNQAALERTVEYFGQGTREFSPDMRFTIANMTAELGGLNGIFEPDARIAEWLTQRSGETGSEEQSGAVYLRRDEQAPYLQSFTVPLERLEPQLARPFSPDHVLDVREAAGMPVDGCFIGACTTTEEELVLAALVLERALRGARPISSSAKRLVVPGCRAIHERLQRAGLWHHYERAGFRIGPPGCSMCLGVASEKALPGEVWLTSQNRNYENRMGPGSLAWLASAATVAASSVEMRVRDPRPYFDAIDPATFERLLSRAPKRLPPAVASAAPAPPASLATSRAARPPRPSVARSIAGRVQRFGHHVDTDAIIPGEFCHLAELGELGRHAFHYARPEFYARAREGRTIIVAGKGWGTGSSREQAVWALAGAGIRAVIASSYAFIHRRNLANEALDHFTIDDPDFDTLVQEDDELVIQLDSGEIVHVASGRRFRSKPSSLLIRELTLEGGLIASVQRQIRERVSGPESAPDG